MYTHKKDVVSKNPFSSNSTQRKQTKGVFLEDNRQSTIALMGSNASIIQRVELDHEAPIHQVDNEDVEGLANRLRTNSAYWRGVDPNNDQNDEYSLQDNDWYQQRMIGVADISQDIAGQTGEAQEEEGYRHFVYELDGEPVAMQSLRNSPLENYNNYTWIESLVTHPGTADGGATMIENTVNISQQDGNNGRVVLAAYGESANFYERLGFQETDDEYTEVVNEIATDYPVYTLNPGESDLWNFTDGIWNLNYFEDRPQYLI